MNAPKSLFTQILPITGKIIRRNANNYYNKPPRVKTIMNFKDNQQKKNLEKYMEYRQKCWNDYYKEINIIKHKINNTMVDNDLNEWETEKANEYVFRN